MKRYDLALIKWIRAWIQPRSVDPINRFCETIARVITAIVIFITGLMLVAHPLFYPPTEATQALTWLWYILLGTGLLIFLAEAWLLDQGRLNLATNMLVATLLIAAGALMWQTDFVNEFSMRIIMMTFLIGAMVVPRRITIIHLLGIFSILVVIVAAMRLRNGTLTMMDPTFAGVLANLLPFLIVEAVILFLFRRELDNQITALYRAKIAAETASARAETAMTEAQQANRLKSEFLATMSHELRTPLNPIIGFADMTIRAPLSDEQRKLFLQKISENAKRLLGLIDNILDMSRIEAGRLEIVKAAYDPASLIREVVSANEALFTQKGLKLITTIDPALPPNLIGDKARIGQVLTNLLSNAAKFTDQGEVVVTAGLTSQKTAWQITVSDTGIGIPPHAQQFIFETFRQVEQSSTRKYGGAGLGLAICQNLVRGMDGTLVVRSSTEPDNHGSTFTVTLPVIQPTLARAA